MNIRLTPLWTNTPPSSAEIEEFQCMMSLLGSAGYKTKLMHHADGSKLVEKMSAEELTAILTSVLEQNPNFKIITISSWGNVQ